MSEQETDLLAELISERFDCLRRLRQLVEQQVSLVEGGDLTRLLDVLGAKQRLLWELERIERALDPFRGQNPESRRWRSGQLRQQCAEQSARCTQLLEEIMAEEKRSQSRLVERRERVAAELRSVEQAGRACSAYLTASAPPGSRLDLSAEE
ncbi:MAG TPA: hypothetical protein EYP56_17255 [Planctomycetaceae bacterium]|nr:hypothetical protein [Planctomycetaceae bacterium]HIQ21280.1 hypothetical protein [Planctomycetota bacterium]